jgi:hypothetical protein
MSGTTVNGSDQAPETQEDFDRRVARLVSVVTAALTPPPNQEPTMSDYRAKAHAMQSGVAMKMNYDPSETTPKHLRVGVNSAMCDHAALVRLLLEKGIVTEEEYEAAITEEMGREVARYEAWLSEHLGGKNITLG